MNNMNTNMTDAHAHAHAHNLDGRPDEDELAEQHEERDDDDEKEGDDEREGDAQLGEGKFVVRAVAQVVVDFVREVARAIDARPVQLREKRHLAHGHGHGHAHRHI